MVYRVSFNRHCFRRTPACMPTMWGWCRSQHSACLCANPSHSAAAELPGRLGLQQSVERPSRMGGHPTEEAHGYRLTPDKSCKLLRRGCVGRTPDVCVILGLYDVLSGCAADRTVRRRYTWHLKLCYLLRWQGQERSLSRKKGCLPDRSCLSMCESDCLEPHRKPTERHLQTSQSHWMY